MRPIAILALLGAAVFTTAAQAHPHHGHGHRYAAPANHYAPPARYQAPHSYAPPAGYAPSYSHAPYRHGYAAQTHSYGGYPYGGGYAYPPHGYVPGFDAGRRGPSTESYNYGYAGGPTFGMGRRPVINGVQIFGAPDGK